MRSALSRNHSTSSPSHKTPRKSSSFLSLRREKEKVAPLPESSAAHGRDSTSSSMTPPSSYIDAYSLSSSRTGQSKSRRDSPSRNALALSTAAQATSEKPSKASPKDTAFAFPSYDSTEELTTPTPLHRTPDQYLRTRSRTGPSGKSKWDAASNIPPSLRFSGSSSTQHTETPPRTPDDLTSSTDSFEQFPVVVAAPVFGVETMDALVDGMNGGDDMLGSLSRRARFGIPNHHPLYQPPLPTPPPGVILGVGGGKPRKYKLARKQSQSGSSSEGDSLNTTPVSSRSKPRRNRPHSARGASGSTMTPVPSTPPPSSLRSSPSSSRVSTPAEKVASRPSATPPPPPPPPEIRKTVIPSISEIIRNHAPPEVQARSKFRSSSVYTPSQGHGTVPEEPESEPEPLTVQEEAELVSRSSIDSVADEVRRTLRHQKSTNKPPPPAPPSAFIKRHSAFSDTGSLYSPRSDPGANASIYSSSAASIYQSHSPIDVTFLSMVKPSASQAVAQYLRSTRLTTLVKLTRQPHASQDNPLTVSFSDLGSQNGFPVVVFLGLGCVRHVMGLYDEMAECLGLRLITIDRWGLGRTESRSKSSKGIIQWASAVEEVLDHLRITECSIMAHSAGAPYALSFANKVPSRIRGDICLLAPWVGGGESSGYRWLKYVPNGILRTAQAAEWKIQAWMIGKPPTIAYEGIGYTAPKKEQPKETVSSRSLSPKGSSNSNISQQIHGEARSRPSIGSSNFSEYDDLHDFDGRFGSHSTLGIESRSPSQLGHDVGPSGIFVGKRKTSRGFLERLKGSSSTRSEEKGGPGKKLKGLRSMGSLKGKAQSQSRKSSSSSPQVPPTLQIEVGLGLEEVGWSNSIDIENKSGTSTATHSLSSVNGPYLRSDGRRSISFGSSKVPASMPSSPSPSTVTTTFAPSGGPRNYQAALGNALIAASHAESAKGTHNDLLQILNHDNQPWGFSYAAYPHNVRVWYGDRDEKIAENAVRWMERTMGSDRCSVKVVKGADHGLMYRSSVVVDVLERLLSAWKGDDRQEPFAGLR